MEHRTVILVHVAAAIVAMCAWLGLALQFVDFRLVRDNAFAALGEMLLYFTIFTNLLIAVAFSAIATGFTVAPWCIGGAMLAIVLVAVIYSLLLRDLPLGNAPTAIVSNALVHRVTPALVVLFWIACVPHGTLRPTDTVWWVAYPLAYTAYALVRGAITRRFPYAFLDAGAIGWPAALRNAAGIAAGFVAASFILLSIDHLGRAR